MSNRNVRPAALIAALCLLVPAVAQESARERRVHELVAAARERTQHAVRYDGRYVKLDYPGGDVPAEIGVCSDEIIRIYRAIGVDLQQRVHEDMRANFRAYPQKWGARRPDRNIDHRRVPNLAAFFKRHGTALAPSRDPNDYQPGDIVTWNLVKDGDLPHIGIVVDERGPSGNWMIVHNIGAGPQMEDRLFEWQVTGHFRY